MKKNILIVTLFAFQSIFSQNTFPPSANVGIGTTTPNNLLEVDGIHNNSRILLHSLGNGDNAGQADLMLWASEPGLTYTGVGIGNNIHNYKEGLAGISLLNPARGGSYIRLLDNAMLFNVVSSLGQDKQALIINGEGNVGVGTINPLAKVEIQNTAPGITSMKVFGVNGYLLIDNVGSGENYYSANNFHEFQINGVSTARIASNGNVGIGTTNPDSKLTVAGNIHAQEVKVTINAGLVPDYVFANDYKLKSLQEVEDFIKQNSHLPEIPSANEIEKNGLMLAEMNLSLLKKIEEMTLYMIEQNKHIKDLTGRLEKVEASSK